MSSSQVTLVGNTTRERRYTNGCATSGSMSRVNVVVPATQARPGTCPNLLRRSEMSDRTPFSGVMLTSADTFFEPAVEAGWIRRETT